MATPAIQINSKLPTVALVGRANVGKSTLFNRLIEEDKALVSNIAGTTRTNNEGDVLWRGTYIHIIDTGGQDTEENEQFANEIIRQAEHAIALADLIVIVTDSQVGVVGEERELVKTIRDKTKDRIVPLLLVANKCDNAKIEARLQSSGLRTLGLGEPLPVSGTSGRGIGDFLDQVYTLLKKTAKRPKVKKPVCFETSIRISLIGKPNVGKSSLFNKLIGEEKVIVSPVPHTTREPFDTTLTYKFEGKPYTITFVDTAGIRRKAKVEGVLERQGVGKSIEQIQKSDIILLVLDGSEPLSSQDMQLGGLIEMRSKSVILIINKWDLTSDNSDNFRNEVKKKIYGYFPHLNFASILLVSSLTGYRIHQIFPTIIQVDTARKTEIPQDTLTDFIKAVTHEHRPARDKGTRHPEILGLRQLNTAPPIFEIFIKYRTSLHRSYLNFIEHKLREQFNFLGTPIVIKMSKMKR